MDKAKLRIVFMGTPIIAKNVLEALILEGYNIVGLIAQPDKPIGRKKELYPVPTKEVALKYNIPVFQPFKIRLEYDFLKELNPDLIITLAYGQIVPQEVLDIPRLGCINLHGSLLPKYRGAAPIQYALINNEVETGVTLMEMTAAMDAGRMFSTKKVKIDQEDNSTSLFIKIGEAAKELILESLPDYVDGKLIGIPQDEKLVTFSPTIKKEQEKLSFDLSMNEFLGWIRGLSEEPGGYIVVNNQKWKILKAKSFDLKHGEIGKLESLDKKLLLQLKDGRIEILKIQKEGKAKMDASSFLNGVKVDGLIAK